MGFWGKKSIDELETTELKERISKHITFVNNFYNNNQTALEEFANILRAKNGFKHDIIERKKLSKQPVIIFSVKGQLSDFNDYSTQGLNIPELNDTEKYDTEKNDCDSLIKEMDDSINATNFSRDKKANKFTIKITDNRYVTYENLKVILEFASEIYGLTPSTGESTENLTGGKRRRRSTKKRKSSKKSRKARRSRRHRRNRSSKK